MNAFGTLLTLFDPHEEKGARMADGGTILCVISGVLNSKREDATGALATSEGAHFRQCDFAPLIEV